MGQNNSPQTQPWPNLILQQTFRALCLFIAVIFRSIKPFSRRWFLLLQHIERFQISRERQSTVLVVAPLVKFCFYSFTPSFSKYPNLIESASTGWCISSSSMSRQRSHIQCANTGQQMFSTCTGDSTDRCVLYPRDSHSRLQLSYPADISI